MHGNKWRLGGSIYSAKASNVAQTRPLANHVDYCCLMFSKSGLDARTQAESAQAHHDTSCNVLILKRAQRGNGAAEASKSVRESVPCGMVLKMANIQAPTHTGPWNHFYISRPFAECIHTGVPGPGNLLADWRANMRRHGTAMCTLHVCVRGSMGKRV